MRVYISKRVVLVMLLSVFVVSTVLAQDISEKARRYMARGEIALQEAETNADFIMAVKEFEQVIKYAPKWADGYYNLGIVQEKAGLYSNAIINLKKYLNLTKNSADAENVRILIYGIEYKKEKRVNRLNGKWKAIEGDNNCLNVHYQFAHGGPFSIEVKVDGDFAQVLVPTCSDSYIQRVSSLTKTLIHTPGCYRKFSTPVHDGKISIDYRFTQKLALFDGGYKTSNLAASFTDLIATKDGKLKGKMYCGHTRDVVFEKQR